MLHTPLKTAHSLSRVCFQANNSQIDRSSLAIARRGDFIGTVRLKEMNSAMENNQSDVGSKKSRISVLSDGLKRSLGAHTGLLLVLVACVFRAIAIVLVKVVAGRVSPSQITAIGQLFIFIMASPPLVWWKVSVRLTLRQMVCMLVWIISETLALWVMCVAVQHIPAGDAMAILFSNPMFTGILAWFLLRERFTLVDAAFTVLALSGVILIAKPPFLFGSIIEINAQYGNTALGVGAAVASVALYVIARVAWRNIGMTSSNPWYQLWLFGLIGFILLSVISTFLGMWTIPVCGKDRKAVLMIGIFIATSYIPLGYANRTESAANVAMILSNVVIVTFFLEFLIVGTVPHWLSVLGTILILSSSLGVSIKKAKANKDSLTKNDENDAREESEIDNKVDEKAAMTNSN